MAMSKLHCMNVLLIVALMQPCVMGSSITGACTSDIDCELLGKCTAGKCVCSQGFTGPSCGQLNLQPIESLPDARVWPLNIDNPVASSWGFSVVKGDDAKYYGVVNVGCGKTATSVSGTYAALLSSSRPDTGFEFVSMITPPTSFNPHLIRSPNGTYLLYYRVNDLDNHTICTGTSSVTNPSPHIKPCKPNESPMADSCVVSGLPDGPGINMYVAWADTPTGNWRTTNVSITGCGNFHKSNPTTTFLQDGRVMLSYRFNYEGEMIGFAVAETFRGPFQSIANLSHNGGNDEDSFLWQQPDGSLHILYHNGPEGKHAFSKDGTVWTKGMGDAFVLEYNTTNGGGGKFRRRERPEVFFENGVPSTFYTAVQLEDGSSMSFVQSFRT